MELVGFFLLQFVLAGVSGFVGLLLFAICRFATKRAGGRTFFLLSVLVFPTLATFYCEGAVISLYLWQSLNDIDNPLGGVFRCPLAERYQLVVRNKFPGDAFITRAATTYGTPDVQRVRGVQVINTEILVTFVKQEEDRTETVPNGFVAIDALTETKTDYQTLGELEALARRRGVKFGLISPRQAAFEVSSRNAPSPFLFLLLFVPVLVASGWLLMRLVGLRKSRTLSLGQISAHP